MLLTEFFNQPEGDSRADNQATKKVSEAKRMSSKNDPCWKGHHMVGTKTKGGEQVPNCVPVTEDTSMSDIITARQYISQAIRNPAEKHNYFNFLKSIREKHGSEYSTHVHQEASKLAQQGNN
jgi:hypothetical protein